MKVILLSIRDFALPVPRVGSIETHSGFGRQSKEGIEVHQKIQKARAESHANYRSEVALSHEFSRGDYTFRIAGRIDGLFEDDPPRIEEIKSTFDLRDLAKRLRNGAFTHPYALQLKTYGYFYWAEKKVMPELQFHLVSTRSWETEDQSLTLDIDSYEGWVDLRLEELVREAERAEKRVESRKAMAQGFSFPFKQPRHGQLELIATVEQGMVERKRTLVQAPTGLGKTVGVLYPSLKDALSRGQSVVYVTPKNSQHSVAENAVDHFNLQGTAVKSLTITAKSKICLKNEPLCNPDYCEYAKEHYTKVAAAGLPGQLSRKRRFIAKTFKEMGQKYEVCPFELQREAAKLADVVICDYNYVFAPRSALGSLNVPGYGQVGNPNLVIDEAHNLPARSMDYYSPALSTVALERMRPAIKELPEKFRKEAETLLDSSIATVQACRPEGAHKPLKIEAPSAFFLEQEAQLRAFLSRYLATDVEIQPGDAVLRLCFYWSEFSQSLEFVSEPLRPEFFTTFHPLPVNGAMVKITCCDASAFLESAYEDYENVVGFSATLKPFDYYAKLSGLEGDKLKCAEFSSPFPRQHRKLLVIPQISTKYSQRERSYAKIAEAIQRIASVKPGNYFAFFPSFEFLTRVRERFTPPDGFTAIAQGKEMKSADIEAVLSHLRDGREPTILFAVQGGVFSEGVDYPGDMIIGAFVVGPPLPPFDLEREEMRGYYDREFGTGFEYAYTYPAMAKAVQAAGRVIRSETDRGLIVLIDNRFLESNYAQSMPTDWFDESPAELVSQSILREVSDFWKERPL